MDTRQRTAARLASRAAACAFLSRTIPDAVIDPRTGADRSYRAVPNESRGDYGRLFAEVASYEGEAMLCGPGAAGPSQYSGSGRDGFKESLLLAGDDGPKAAQLLHTTREKAQEFVRGFGDVISNIAAELDARGVMTGQQIEEALSRSLDQDKQFRRQPRVQTPPGPPPGPFPLDYSKSVDTLRWRVCCHEAGHAVAARYQRLPVEFAKVDLSNPRWAGSVEIDEERLVVDPRKEMMVMAAGPAAERLICGPSGTEQDAHRNDFARFEQAATRYCRDDARVQAKMMGTCRYDAEEFANEFRYEIERVAQALYARETLTGDEIDTLLNE